MMVRPRVQDVVTEDGRRIYVSYRDKQRCDHMQSLGSEIRCI